MLSAVIYLTVLTAIATLGQDERPCPAVLSVNITDGVEQPDDAVLKDGVYFDANNTYVDGGDRWGCACNVKKCIRKCCAENEMVVAYKCVPHSQVFELTFFEGMNVSSDVNMSDFAVVHNRNCSASYQRFMLEGNAELYMQTSGNLFIRMDYEDEYEPKDYCIDFFNNTISAYLCEFYEPGMSEMEVKILANGMIISMPFLLATFLVYVILPDRNIHRKALIFYVLNLLLGYISLVIVQLYDGKIDSGLCQSLGYSIIFFCMVSFFWMNVMCIDMWFAFSGLRGFNGRGRAEKKRFIFYCLYAWGMPVLHVLIVLLLNTYANKDAAYWPGVGHSKCFLEDGLPNLFYFYGPMAVLIAINVLLFILTAIRIQKVKKETSMLKHSDSKRHSYEDDKQKFNLYLKLLFAMGVNWSMEVVSWAFLWKMGASSPTYIWYLTDFCNAMYGVFIFFIFVFKKKIWKSLQKRYYVCIGKPHLAHSMTMTQTTRSSNYSTTETEVNDHRLSEMRNGRGEERALRS